MNKLKTIIDLVNQGDKAKLWKYLNKGIYSKKDKIDVVKSKGGQGGGQGGGRNVEYLDLTADPNSFVILELMGAFVSSVRVNFLGKEIVSGGLIIGMQIDDLENNLKAICIDKDLKFTSFSNDLITLYTYETFTKDFTPEIWDLYNSIPRMTEEEFYKIN